MGQMTYTVEGVSPELPVGWIVCPGALGNRADNGLHRRTVADDKLTVIVPASSRNVR